MKIDNTSVAQEVRFSNLQKGDVFHSVQWGYCMKIEDGQAINMVDGNYRALLCSDAVKPFPNATLKLIP